MEDDAMDRRDARSVLPRRGSTAPPAVPHPGAAVRHRSAFDAPTGRRAPIPHRAV
jgi:hypothetical protein